MLYVFFMFSFGQTTKKLLLSNNFSDFGYTYTMQNIDNLSKYKTPKQFINEYVITEFDWNNFAKFIKNDSLKMNQLMQNEKLIIADYIKASIARQLFKTPGFVESINKKDITLNAAIKYISTP